MAFSYQGVVRVIARHGALVLRAGDSPAAYSLVSLSGSVQTTGALQCRSIAHIATGPLAPGPYLLRTMDRRGSHAEKVLVGQ